jgi:hypothetical protein
MEFLITVRETDGTSTKHPVIAFDFITGIEEFCQDYGYKFTDIVAVVVIDR